MWLMMAVVASAQTTNLTALLQQGLMEEQANQNLDAAIANYQQLAAQFDKDRQVAATAIFRIGECYRTEGRTNEAAAQYQRILHDFSDQKSLATLSQQNLKGMGMVAPEAYQAGPLAPVQQVVPAELSLQKQIDQSQPQVSSETEMKISQAKQQLAVLRAQLETIEKTDAGSRAYVVQEISPNPMLVGLLDQRAQLVGDLGVAELKKDYSTNQPEVITQTAALNSIRTQINDSVNATMADLRTKIDASEKMLAALQEQINRSQPQVSSVGSTPAASASDAEDKEIQRIQQVIQNSPDLINQPGPDGNTELIKAAGAGEIKVVTYLLDHGADVNQNTGKSFPLLEAVAAGNRSMVELLLSRGADVNARNGGSDALHMAVRKKFQAVTEVLLAHKADVNVLDANGDTPLVEASRMDASVKIVKMLLSAGANPNLANRNGEMPLHLAAYDSPEAVVALLSAGAEVNMKDTEGRTPLSYAAKSGNLKTIKLLLDAKADPNGNEFDPPLLLATKLGNTNIMELLLSAGANPNAVGNLEYMGDPAERELEYENHCSHMTPLWLAIYKDNLPAVQLLLRFKADPNDTQTTKRSLLFDALYHSAILEAMLNAGANMEVTTPDEAELTPLGTAASFNFAKAVEILLKHGANPNSHNRNGVTPLHRVAYDLVDGKIAELLLAAGANPNVRTGNGRTPLDELNHRRDDTQSTSEQRAKAIILADLLRRHGARDRLPDWDRITVSRPDASFSAPVFFKATNDWNHFTLLETIYEFYNAERSYPIPIAGGTTLSRAYEVLPFPDLAHIVIARPNRDSTNETRITVNLLNDTNGIDCAKDLPLQFGDVVVVPERDHSLVVQSAGLTESQSKTIVARFAGKVQLIAGGQKTDITLYEPQWSSMLNNVLQHEEAQRVLLSSSDLAHVKVTRHDAQTGKKQEWIVDCSSPRTSSNGTQTLVVGNGNGAPLAYEWYKNGTDNSASSAQRLILRAGDVIEVPEKQ